MKSKWNTKQIIELIKLAKLQLYSSKDSDKTKKLENSKLSIIQKGQKKKNPFNIQIRVDSYNQKGESLNRNINIKNPPAKSKF